VRVQDDGEGFAPEESEVGQACAHPRARGLDGGALRLSSAPGHGTSLEIVLRA
jgi:signal transduction histidine kinase